MARGSREPGATPAPRRGGPTASRARWTPWGQHRRGLDRAAAGPPNPSTWAGGGPGRCALKIKSAGPLGSPGGLQSPARGANHLCHTVTIILHKIIIKNSNFSASEPASGLLAAWARGCAVITPLITSAWRLPPRARNQG